MCVRQQNTRTHTHTHTHICTHSAQSALLPLTLPPMRIHPAPQVRVELYDRKQTRFISAHNAALAALALSADGKRLATASDKGTLVRVWSTADGSKLQVRTVPGCGLCQGVDCLLLGNRARMPAAGVRTACC